MIYETYIPYKIAEGMIPVRIATTYDHMLAIANFTKEHYNQKQVLFYTVGTDVTLV
jgi:hypothetical protein